LKDDSSYSEQSLSLKIILVLSHEGEINSGYVAI